MTFFLFIFSKISKRTDSFIGGKHFNINHILWGGKKMTLDRFIYRANQQPLEPSPPFFQRTRQPLWIHKTPTHFGCVCWLGMEADPFWLQKGDRNSTVLKLCRSYCRDMPIHLYPIIEAKAFCSREKNFKKIGFSGWVVNSWNSFPGSWFWEAVESAVYFPSFLF